jgi:hypothetical protein
MMAAGKKQVKIISAELDDINDITVPSIKDKYKKKNEEIDKCDETFDELIAILQDEEAKVIADIADAKNLVNKIAAELGKTPDSKLKDLHDRAREYLDDLEGKKQELAIDRDFANGKISILDDLDKKVVTAREVNDIKNTLEDLKNAISARKQKPTFSSDLEAMREEFDKNMKDN